MFIIYCGRSGRDYCLNGVPVKERASRCRMNRAVIADRRHYAYRMQFAVCLRLGHLPQYKKFYKYMF